MGFLEKESPFYRSCMMLKYLALALIIVYPLFLLYVYAKKEQAKKNK